jgi:hypothetical protein
MAITYPLSLPVATKAIQSIEIRAVNAVAYARSPFTFAGQAFAYAGQMWTADVSLKPMKRADAEQWNAWLLSLRGQLGTFLMGDSMGATARGVATGTPLVNGASQTGGSLVIDGATSSTTGWLKAGDYIQLGSGSSSRLHKVLADANSDGGGNVTLDIWPHIRVAPADNAAVTVSDAKGLFRLSSNDQGFSINESAIYGITFAAMEAV